MKLHVSGPLLNRVEGHLRRRKTEQVAFLLLAPVADGLTVSDIYLVPPDELVFESRCHAEVSEQAQAKIIKMASDRRLLLGEIHSHPGCRRDTSFSPSDLAGFDDFVPHIFWRLHAKQYVALVFGDSDFDGLAWLDDPKTPVPIEGLVVDGRVLRPTDLTIHDLQRRANDAERYSRQIAMFGKDGQIRLAAASVAVVGVGGLGCHVIQQLAFAGVKTFFLIDPDRVDRSNLNRFVIATDADLGRMKVDVAREYVQRVQPGAKVITVGDSLLSAEAFAALSNARFVFGCLDNDGPRLVLLELCCARQTPYLDLATDVPAPGTFGGRAVFSGIGSGCLFCREELDQKEIWRFFATPQQRVDDDKIYGIDRSALGETGPSVVFLNGVVASLAVTEFAAFTTGIRKPVPHLNYRGEMGIVTTTKVPAQGCYYCGDVWSGRATANLTRYLQLPKSETVGSVAS